MTQNTEHTPGPWFIDQIRGRYRVRINGRGWGCLAKVVVRMDGDGEDAAEGVANAHLITAAPDLLRVAEIIEEVYREGSPNTFHRRINEAAGGNFAGLLMASLGKARGRL